MGAILLTGASGFIGRHLADALVRDGHEVVCAVRDPARMHDQRFRYVAVDFLRDVDAASWLPRLAGIDVVINAVGILREHGSQTFDAIHSRTPRALFAACVQAGVHRVVQISALGADEQAVSRYHLSKKEADDYLASLPLRFVIVQPSLIYGQGGTSAKLFSTLATLPLIMLPGDGRQQVQPVHIDDLVTAIRLMVERDMAPATRLPVVGPEPMSMRTFIATLRQAMGAGRARFMPIPLALVRIAAAAGRLLPGALLDPETLAMLERGNTGDAAPLTALLGHAPRPVRHFIEAPQAASLRLKAKLNWLLPMLRLTVALVWILTGIVSLGLYPVDESYALLARTGIVGWLAPVMLYGAALLDLGFGIATLALPVRRRRWLWIAQLAVIGFYTVIISFRLPEFWLHPYGPLSKNLPMLGAILLLLELEDEQGSST
ncbi:MAG: dehydrogenase [Burkholderia sp.]|nr:dehydrogenase [Burkholderia sp.]